MGVRIADTFGPQTKPPDEEPALRRLILTPASTIRPRRVRWLWNGRVAYGTLALLAGREGLGKSTLAYHLAAEVTRGRLEGEDLGTPRSVLVCASEDSWEHTIVPRLIAAGADLERVYRVEIETYNDMHISLSLPRDFQAVEEAAALIDAGLMILDPLMSVLDSRLDTHKDREIRQALEPLATLADKGRMAIIGLIHHNKSGSTDALQLVMGSKAFAAVARSVHTCIPDPDDDTQNRRLFATSKNNLGRLDLPVLGFTISSHAVETEDDGTAWTGRLSWTGEVAGSMHEIMTRTADPERTATAEAADWLHDYLTSRGGESAKTDIEKAGRVAGHAQRTIGRARERLRLEYRSTGFPRQTFWSLPGATEPDKPVDITEPKHPADEDPESGDNGQPGPSGAESSRATYTPMSGASASRATYTDEPLPDPSHASHAKPGTTVAQLGLTSGNAKTDPDPHAGARARRHPHGTTGDLAPLNDSSGASRASQASPPAHVARLDNSGLADTGPPCPDCSHPIDSDLHAKICEDTP